MEDAARPAPAGFSTLPVNACAKASVPKLFSLPTGPVLATIAVSFQGMSPIVFAAFSTSCTHMFDVSIESLIEFN